MQLSEQKWDQPTELDQVNRRVMQLEIEESALKMNQIMQVNID